MRSTTEKETIRRNEMAVDQGYLDHIMEKFSHQEEISVKKMFGGAGIFYKNKMFALIYSDTLFFKVDDTNRKEYVEKGAGPFEPPFMKKKMSMPYYEVPVDVLEANENFNEWAERSMEIALKR